MAAVVVLVLLVLASLATARDNLTTLDDFFLDVFRQHLREYSSWVLATFKIDPERPVNQGYASVPWSRNPLPLAEELLEFKNTLEEKMLLGFAASLENLTARSLYDDLDGNCSAPLDLRVEARNATCVMAALGKTMSSRLTSSVEVTMQDLSRDCVRNRLALCSAVDPDCTSIYEGRLRLLLVEFVDEAVNDHGALLGSTPLEIVQLLMTKHIVRMSQVLQSTDTFLTLMAYMTGSVPSLEPFTFENVIQPWNNEVMKSVLVNQKDAATESRDGSNWGIIKSDTRTVNFPCSYLRNVYSRNSEEFKRFVYRCFLANMIQSHSQLLLCANRDPASTPLTLTKDVPALYFSSRCLCVASDGDDCGVEALPRGVDAGSHCLSVLLRDFQKQVWFRPAVTYLDYASQTRLPVCQFANLLRVAFRRECIGFHVNASLDWITSSRCYFKNLVNKDLNCSESLAMNALNHSELCSVKFFMHHVLCEGDDGAELRVTYYGAGASPLVLLLTYLDVAVRLLTLVTYLACPQLRNLPGKLLIGYMTTALLRLLVVRASLLEDLYLAVRLDVAMDFSSTLWLTCYLHFLTVSIRDLRTPNSLSPGEAHQMLFGYAMLGWALPGALSAAFFYTDDVLESRMQVGQLLFLVFNFVALFGNLYMFYLNFSFYYDVKNGVRDIKRGVTARSIFADLFNFALKTSVLSGAGITIRLVFTQIQGLEQLLGIYHALGTLQGLLIFVLFGCNQEARAFWVSVFRSSLRRCRLRQRASLHRNSI